MKMMIARIKQFDLSFNHGLTLIITFMFIIAGCHQEEVNVDTPSPGPVQIQMHNFNLPLSGGTLDGTSPGIFYFKQKEDGSFVFMLTSDRSQGYETNWGTDYVLVHADKNGVIQKTEVMKLPVKDGLVGRFGYVWDNPVSFTYLSDENAREITAGPSYVADDKGFLYYYPLRGGCFCANRFFNLNPETGNADYFLIGADRPLAKVFRTSDGGFITIGGLWSPDYEKYSESGSFQYRQPMKYWEARPSYTYLEDRGGDSYFIVLYNGRFAYSSITNELFTENTAKSFFYFKEYFGSFNASRVDVEIRFGLGKTQKAHRIIPNGNNFEYKNYVDVPFEVWDITNNRQVMAAFRDQGSDGEFNLVSKKIDYSLPSSNPSLSWEQIHIFPDIPYASQPNQSIISNSVNEFEFAKRYAIWGYLTEGAKWDKTSLPESTFSIKAQPRPGPQLIKVNANGSSVVKDNFVLGSVPFKTLYKSVPYQDGFATLINAPQISADAPTQLVLLDANFNQTVTIPMVSSTTDYGHQLEANNDRIFYAHLKSTTTLGAKASLLLYVIRNNIVVSKVIPFEFENYRITPTKTGGVAVVAWVRPTDDTRDLFFMEFDEKLDLIKSSYGN